MSRAAPGGFHQCGYIVNYCSHNGTLRGERVRREGQVSHIAFLVTLKWEMGDLTPSPVPSPAVAAKDGQQTYSVPGSTEADDVCVFSGVLLEALWGTKKAAFSELAPNNITSSSLGKYLRAEVPRAAQRYGLTLKPTVLPAFPEGDNIYLTTGLLTSTVPPFEWPAPQGFASSQLPPSSAQPESFDFSSSAQSVDTRAPGGFREEIAYVRKKPALSLVERLRRQDNQGGIVLAGLFRLVPRDA